jgi:two-component system phosphate regulon sensor histidine kinase PhoR
VNDAAEASRPWADSPRLTLTAQLSDFLIAHVDPGRIRQVVYNLLSNAIKYNRSGGTVEVNVNFNADTIELTVDDTGLGISQEDVIKLFARFFRAIRRGLASSRARVSDCQSCALL